MAHAPVIALDGPGGSGKGTVAREVARRLGWNFLDSGALYRILAHTATERGINPDDVKALVDCANRMHLEFHDAGDDAAFIVDGEDVTDRIRTEECGELASRIAPIAEVRRALLERQRMQRQPPGLVADGRDMGTVVFPDAGVKIFLTASAEERAQRRCKQLNTKGVTATLPALLREIRERDERDASRRVAPLKPAPDATILDTTDLTIEEVVERVLALAQEAGITN